MSPLAAMLAAFPADQWDINTDAVMAGTREVAVVGGDVDEAGHSGALLRLVKGAPGMRAALLQAAAQFAAYAALHAEKGTPEADEKARVNRDLATTMRAALIGAGEEA